MTLNSSGPISIGGSTSGQSINLELGRSATAQSSLNENALRTLAGVPSGQISLSNFYGKSNSVTGNQSYTTPGTYTFTVPSGVTSISVLCIGGGAGGTIDHQPAGAGGGLSYTNDISVTPGQIFTVMVGAGGVGRDGNNITSVPAVGGDSSFTGDTQVLAKGGFTLNQNTTYGQGTVKYDGGAGGSWGGGGAAGYVGNGGNGGVVFNAGGGSTITAGTGGGGGGGSYVAEFYDEFDNLISVSAYACGGGGGVGLTGASAAGGQGGAYAGGGGYGGSSGANGGTGQASNGGIGGNGGGYGGAGGGGGFFFSYAYEYTNWGVGGNGAGGAVRIIWGSGRTFPNNAAIV